MSVSHGRLGSVRGDVPVHEIRSSGRLRDHPVPAPAEQPGQVWTWRMTSASIAWQSDRGRRRHMENPEIETPTTLQVTSTGKPSFRMAGATSNRPWVGLLLQQLVGPAQYRQLGLERTDPLPSRR